MTANDHPGDARRERDERQKRRRDRTPEPKLAAETIKDLDADQAPADVVGGVSWSKFNCAYTASI